jgi:hypothetical protein
MPISVHENNWFLGHSDTFSGKVRIIGDSKQNLLCSDYRKVVTVMEDNLNMALYEVHGVEQILKALQTSEDTEEYSDLFYVLTQSLHHTKNILKEMLQ